MILVEKTIKICGYNPNTQGKTSTKKCYAICDYCGAEYQKTIREVFRGHRKINKDACRSKKCINLKYKDVYRNSTSKNIKNINNKRKNTCLEKFGVTNAAKLEEKKEKYKETILRRYGVDHFSKTKKFSAKVKTSYEEILNRSQKKQYRPLFSEEEYIGQRTFYRFICNVHNIEFETSVFNLSFDHLQCPACNKKSSGPEKEVGDFLENLGIKVERNYRGIISPYEVDLYLRNLNIGVEFHGLYWHSEVNKRQKLHFEKFFATKQKGTQLFQIYEDEWRDKRDIWKSILSIKSGNASYLYNARKLIINTIPDKKNIKNFLNLNHLQGYSKSSKEFSLEDEHGKIVMCLTLRKPFTKKNNSVEIARLCSSQHSVIRGGFPKLMKYVKIWAKECEFDKILTYSDCRYSQGITYEKYGFSFEGHTGIGYDYTDFKQRYGRFKFRAKNGLTEKQVAEENNVYKIYNAGNYRWVLHL